MAYQERFYAALEAGISLPLTNPELKSCVLDDLSGGMAPAVEMDAPDDVEATSTDYAAASWVPASSYNYTRGRSWQGVAYRVTKIAVHTVQGSYGSCINWFGNSQAQVSAHYVLASGGAVTQMVREADMAWHVKGANAIAVGLEHEGWVDDGTPPSEAMLDSSARLSAHLCKRYGLDPDTDILGHRDFAGNDHRDPGDEWPMVRYKALVKKYMGAAPKPPTPPAQTGTLYRVRCGSFREAPNADALVTRLKKAGYDAVAINEGNARNVYAGSFSVRANADALASELKEKGFAAVVIEKGAGTPPTKPPVKPTPPAPKNSLVPAGFKPLAPRPGTYQDRHPTRYEFRPDVADLIRRIYERFPNVHINTYHDHPEGYWRTPDSFDVWARAGRNYPIDLATGDQVLDFVFSDPNPPLIEWVIWRRRWWLRSRGTWEPFGNGTVFENHDDHLHFTFLH